MTGSSKGKVLIMDTETMTVLKTLKFSGNAIKSIEFARRGRYGGHGEGREGQESLEVWRTFYYVEVAIPKG